MPDRRGRWRAPSLRRRVAAPLFAVVTLVFLCSGTAAHPPWAEFADWFRSLKEPGTEGKLGAIPSCCSPERDCQMTDYETDAAGHYWITTAGERIEVPLEKILQRTDNPTGRAVACFAITTGIRSYAALSEGPKANRPPVPAGKQAG